MKNLVIVESPAKAKTISKYLGEDYVVVSCKGHIRDLATTGKDGLGINVEDNFQPNYVIIKEKRSLVKEIKKDLKKVDKVYLASDLDREGEAIAWSLADEFALNLEDENRIVFNEVTKSAITQAMQNPRKIDMDLVRSQETRRFFDRIIGFKLSKLLKNKIQSRSAGRVQSVALKVIVDREREIEKFIPQEYWTIEAKFATKPTFTATLSKIHQKKAVVNNEEEALTILNSIDIFNVEDVKTATKKRRPKLPFITSTLQQEASTKLGFTAKKTMQVAQKLYEGVDLPDGTVGLITYMRSDSYRLSDAFMAEAKSQLLSDYGKEYLGFYAYKQNKKAQDAHEAIRPTSAKYLPLTIKNHLTNDEYKLYNFIYARTMAALMAQAEFTSNTIELKADKYLFTSSGSVMAFDGYLKIYSPFEQSNDEFLPQLVVGSQLKAQEIVPVQHFSEAPLRYSEARLIKELEEKGIGRPSTYATIIDKITSRFYVELKKASETSKTKVFYPTSQGILTNDKLAEFFSSIINISYTSNMETELDEIADGKIDYLIALKNFYGELIPLVENAYNLMEKAAPENVGENCPQCEQPLIYRQGRFGKFIACSGYPTCTYKASLTKKSEPVYVSRDCPECGAPLVERVSKRFKQKFIGCSAYPKCTYLEKITKKEE